MPLESIAQTLVASGRGVLAADESVPTIKKRHEILAIAATAESCLAYREALFIATGLGKFISGTILFDETLRQKSSAGPSLATVLERRGIIPGIKVDLGTTGLPNFPGEEITRGLDGLPERLKEYRGLGARFTKWRAVLTIGNGLPTRACIEANADALAGFAALSPQANLVPIVEPEILMNGDHPIDRCADVANATSRAVFDALVDYRILLETRLLKPATIVLGGKGGTQTTDDEIAVRTLRCLRRRVPAAVPGIVFLSGGQTPQQATTRPVAINRAGVAPWALTFSFDRALQGPALSAWHRKPENVPAAQAALLDRARQNSTAVKTLSGDGHRSPLTERSRGQEIPPIRLTC